ncbi:hypothetical protein GCM10009760_38300 [Kitasatospora kazusensis]|uniref:DUF6545 domain-containing protein n=1 Tax=Kitasatospora kazusensis TaxID=407974 RepID=A0ABN2ZTV8_9ACTN
MINFFGYLACAVAVLGAAHRLWPARWSSAGARYVVGFTLCMGLSLAVLAPATSALVRVWAAPARDALPLVGAELKLAGEYFLTLMAYSVRSPDPDRPRHRRRQTAGSLLVMAACAATYLAAGVTSADGSTLVVAADGRSALGLHSALFTLHSCWCVGLFTVVIHRAARHVGPGLLRVGLRLIVAAGVAGLVWTAQSVSPLLAGLATGRQEAGEDAGSAPVALLVLVLGISGATVTAWGNRLTGPARWLRTVRDYRRIGPLWSALHAAHPQTALEAPTARAGAVRALRNAEFARYRRIIEIHDGHLALRPYFHPQVPAWAAAAAATPAEGGPGAGDTAATRAAALVEAAVIAAALEAAAAGCRYRAASDYTPHAVRADTDAESAWLVLVTEAFTHSAAVQEIRRRVRAELHPGRD